MFLQKLAQELRSEYMKTRSSAPETENDTENDDVTLETTCCKKCQIRKKCKENKTMSKCMKCKKMVCGKYTRNAKYTLFIACKLMHIERKLNKCLSN